MSTGQSVVHLWSILTNCGSTNTLSPATLLPFYPFLLLKIEEKSNSVQEGNKKIERDIGRRGNRNCGWRFVVDVLVRGFCLTQTVLIGAVERDFALTNCVVVL